MLYAVFKRLMSEAFKCYFRSIHVKGIENIPETGPILFLCNHPSSFMEPMLLACFQHRILNFLVRGDIFENKFLKPILEFTHQIPIYRARDGFENLRKNKSTFGIVYQKLSNHECVLIFPESTTQCVRFLRPLQKGAAHMSLTSVKEYNLKNLKVIPCGVNFTNVLRAGSDVFINIGKAIEVEKWMNAQEPNIDLPAKLTEYFKEKMLTVVYSVPSNIFPEFYDSLSTLYSKIEVNSTERLNHHHDLINAIDRDGKILEKKIIKFSGSMSKVESMNLRITKTRFQIVLLWLRLIGSFLLGIPSLVLHGILLAAVRKLSFSMVKTEFKPPIRIVFSILIILIINLIVFLFIGIKYNFLVGLISSIALYLSFKMFLYFIYYKEQILFLPLLSKSKKSEFILLKNSILELIQKNKDA